MVKRDEDEESTCSLRLFTLERVDVFVLNEDDDDVDDVDTDDSPDFEFFKLKQKLNIIFKL